MAQTIFFLFSDKTYTGSINVNGNSNNTETQSSEVSVEPVLDNKDMCPLLSLEAERFSFVSGFTREITG